MPVKAPTRAVKAGRGKDTPSIVELAKTFSVSTDYLLGLEPLASINVSGLDKKDVATLAMLADRLRATKD